VFVFLKEGLILIETSVNLFSQAQMLGEGELVHLFGAQAGDEQARDFAERDDNVG
jgi:hypothetical protein